MKKLLILTALILSQLSMAFAQGYTIYPIPQTLKVGDESVRFSRTVTIVADKTIDQATMNRAKAVLVEGGFKVEEGKKPSRGRTTLSLLTQPASAFGAEGKFDRHTLIVDKKGITITGEDTNAVFFGLASLEQILEQSEQGGTYRSVSIIDYADQKSRGVIEGFYGFPYSVGVKRDLLRYMMRYKMNTYMYGGKSDPYHSRYWADPYPEQITPEQEKNGWLSQDMVRDITRTSAETKVNFIWAIHPGNHFLTSETAISDIMRKFDKMHQLGVRQFALFVDDVAIPKEVSEMKLTAERVTQLQAAIEKKWNTPSSAAVDTVRPLHFVPQIYCSDFAASATQRQNFMSAIGQTPAHIIIYTTGQGVWTVPNSEHTTQMRNELGRDMAWWWNYPCNDNADGLIYPMDMYNNFVDMPAVRDDARMPKELSHCVGLVSNPMQQGEVAKSALFSVADYAWNNAAFDAKKSWEASFASFLEDEEIRTAYRFIVDYLRWNEPQKMEKCINDFKSTLRAEKPKSEPLKGLLTDIRNNCAIVERLATSTRESDRLLYADLRPWLHRLNAESATALALIEVVESKSNPQQALEKYEACKAMLVDLDSNEDYRVSALEGMGEEISTSRYGAQVSRNHLAPFVDYLYRRAYTLLMQK